QNALFAKEYGGGQNQNRGVHKESHSKRDGGVDGIELQGAPDGSIIFLQSTTLDESGVQVKIVRHYGRADDADGHIQHSNLPQMWRNERMPDFQKARLGLREHKNLDEVTDRNGGHQQQDHGLDRAHAESL